jgi:hypothetical protein
VICVAVIEYSRFKKFGMSKDNKSNINKSKSKSASTVRSIKSPAKTGSLQKPKVDRAVKKVAGMRLREE